MTKHEQELAEAKADRAEAKADAAEAKQTESDRLAAVALGEKHRAHEAGPSAEVKAQMEANRKSDLEVVTFSAKRGEVEKAEKHVAAKKSVADDKAHKAAVKARPAAHYSDEMEVEIRLKQNEGLTRIQAIECASRQRELEGRKVE